MRRFLRAHTSSVSCLHHNPIALLHSCSDMASGSGAPLNKRPKQDQSTCLHNNDLLYSTADKLSKLRKTPRHIPLRNVSPNQASNASFVQIYGTGLDTGDTVPTVLLFFDQRRFIFNAGEGLQRFCTDHKIKMSKIDHIFLTRICSETTGGLPGLLLTLAGIGETGKAAQIWGPSDFQNLVSAVRSFVPNAATVYTHSFETSKDETGQSTPNLLVEDDLVKISAVSLYACVKNVEERNGDSQHPTAELMRISPDANMKEDLSVVYICELPEVIGRFDPEKARAKGLKPGIKYGKLQRGESVMSDDGSEMIHPSDVLGPSTRGPIVIIVDCPSSAHIPALTSSGSLKSYYSGSGKIVTCMVHITPMSVTCCPEYQDWMECFKDSQHVMAGWKDPQCPILKGAARIISKLNLVSPEVFPIAPEIPENSRIENTFNASTETVVAKNLLKFHLKPISALGIDSSSVPEAFNVKAAQEELTQSCPEILEARDYASQIWGGTPEVKTLSLDSRSGQESQIPPASVQHASREEMEIVFLGTCSSQPSKYRNVSAIYIHLFNHGGILLDCGEGTYAQLIRRYGSAGADEVLLSLKCIWISHIHADHQAGLPRILSARRKLMETKFNCVEPILVVGPKQLKRFLDAYEKVECLCMDFLDCSQTTSQAELRAKVTEEQRTESSMAGVPDEMTHHKETLQDSAGDRGCHLQQGIDLAGREKLKSLLHSMGLKSLLSIQVVHCLNAYAVVLESRQKQGIEGNIQQGWKLVYSGDTRPCQALIEASQGATVLIHEATFDDSLAVEAIMKNHSTTKEAIEVGASAGAYRIILTHFSQRYPKIPVFDESYTDRTCIAFDMMSVNLADLPLVPKLLPALKMLFKDEMVADLDDSAP